MPNETYSLKIEGIAQGNHVQNVLHFIADNNDDTPPIAMAKELIDTFDATLMTTWRGMNSNQYAVRWIEAKRILPSGGNSRWLEFPGSSRLGTFASPIGSLSTCAIIKLFSGLSSGVQGRVFCPPPPEAGIENNVVDSVYNDAIIDFANAAESFSDDHDWFWAIYSKKNNASYDVVSATVSGIIGNIGKRRRPV